MYIFIRSSSNPGPRVLRIINYFINKGQKVVYLSPIRSFDKVNTKYRDWGYLGKYDYFDGSGFFNYLKFIFLINLLIVKKIFQNRKVINLVHFSDLEVALLGTILCKIMGIKFVYNIHDNFFQRYNFNNTIKTLLKYLESLYIYLSHKTIVPENFRKKCYPPFVLKKISIIRNLPDFDVSTNRRPFQDKNVSMFYGGWISENRFINLYLMLANEIISRGYSVEFNTCGWGDSSYIDDLREKALSQNIKFNYLGQLSQHETVNRLKDSDLSIAHYDPSKEINLNAASNKIPEIIGSNTILITNNHTEIAKKIRPLNISLQYNESVIEVIEDLFSLINNEEKLSRFIKRANQFYKSEYDIKKLNQSLDEVFREYI